MADWQWAAGTVQGREHRRLGRNNQDALWVTSTAVGLIAVVADGCGSGRQSEVGAQVGVRLVSRAIAANLEQYPQPAFWTAVYSQVLTTIQQTSVAMGDDFAAILQEYWLFTVVGAIVQADWTTVFALGDGVMALNGQLQRWDYPDNAPPYLAYGLCTEKPPDWQILAQLPTSEVEHLLIGTDGVHELIQSRDRALPGKTETVGELAQFWQCDRYFTNPDQLRRRLTLINRDVYGPEQGLQPGLLADDTSLIVVRRDPKTL
jgi:hypothetical protein